MHAIENLILENSHECQEKYIYPLPPYFLANRSEQTMITKVFRFKFEAKSIFLYVFDWSGESVKSPTRHCGQENDTRSRQGQRR
jgi:hypothetical protein